MSFFNNEFDNLRTKEEFMTFVAQSATHQQSEEYNNTKEEQDKAQLSAIRNHICKVISAHFNKNDQNNLKVDSPDLTIYIGHLPQEDKASLKVSLESKGYFCILNQVGDRLTISINAPQI